MAEGQLVVVTLHANKYDKAEKIVFREYGLMKRLLGEASSGGVCDVSGFGGVRNGQEALEDIYYAIYRDGTLRAWNAGFDAHYAQKGGRSIESSSFDAQKEGEQRFFYSLGCTCDQLEQAARGPICGILNFCEDGRHQFGQGVSTYASGEFVNWLTTMSDSFRVADDMGQLRLQFKLFHKPLFDWKGSFFVTPVGVK
ncbi:unnamed protein product [Cylicocyclus nassatus]|uniref:Glycosyltransferase 2-like domain-containing protein n=1 Tax=Cylicocyclus nassatus TaxID=53992 RepID=A0AA36GNI5_CYLNA|nr:unnamed protein product [Cylicocyclus nassatus]